MAGSTDICLKWNNHQGALLSLLYSQLQDKKVVDVTIAAEGKFINVHHVVLCASSPYFEDLLGQQHKPAIVILQNVKFCDVKFIVEYIYKGEVSLSEDQLASFLEAAKCLQIKGLSQKGKTPDPVQEPTVAVEMPTVPEILPTQEAVEPADDLADQAMVLESEDELNLPIQEDDPDVVLVDTPPRPAPEIVNLLDDSMIGEEQENDQGEMESEDSVSNSSDDEDLSSDLSSDSSDDEEREGHPLHPAANMNQQSRPNFFNCGACGRDYQSGYYLRRHTLMGNCHLIPYFRCALCGVCANSRAQIKYHLSGCHKNVLLAEFDGHIIEIKPTLSMFG